MVSDAVSAVPALVPRGGYAVATLIAQGKSNREIAGTLVEAMCVTDCPILA